MQATIKGENIYRGKSELSPRQKVAGTDWHFHNIKAQAFQEEHLISIYIT